ncbi:hypothetical protein D0C16_01215 [Cellvibrio sp. KY-GH-1]|nr:hypothetical protein D0C16_01215 [Cellvibrio sp. KY-GH-1]
MRHFNEKQSIFGVFLQLQRQVQRQFVSCVLWNTFAKQNHISATYKLSSHEVACCNALLEIFSNLIY